MSDNSSSRRTLIPKDITEISLYVHPGTRASFFVKLRVFFPHKIFLIVREEIEGKNITQWSNNSQLIVSLLVTSLTRVKTPFMHCEKWLGVSLSDQTSKRDLDLICRS